MGRARAQSLRSLEDEVVRRWRICQVANDRVSHDSSLMSMCQGKSGGTASSKILARMHACTVAFALIPSSQSYRKHQKEKQSYFFSIFSLSFTCNFSSAGIVMMLIMLITVSWVGYIIIYSRLIY